ncbi:MAG: VOC family protein [Chloroflexota bacterium]|nr:VOC family protein [Chloroflexota bacterium]
MIIGIDHIVILVPDLTQAEQDYTALGFTVTPGGEHAGGLTHNALIALADGSYLELIAFRDTDPLPPALSAKGKADLEALAHPEKAKMEAVAPVVALDGAGEKIARRSHAPLRTPQSAGLAALTRRWMARRAMGAGLLDYALLPTAINEDVAEAQARGMTLDGPTPGSRVRPDGQTVAWQTAIPSTSDLPFLCADLTERDLRVPPGAAREHANGVTGVAEITIAVQDRTASTARYHTLLDLEPENDEGTSVFPLGAALIRLRQPGPGDAAMRAHLVAYDDGAWSVALQGPQGLLIGGLVPSGEGVEFRWTTEDAS